jgi:hypothetical protein
MGRKRRDFSKMPGFLSSAASPTGFVTDGNVSSGKDVDAKPCDTYGTGPRKKSGFFFSKLRKNQRMISQKQGLGLKVLSVKVRDIVYRRKDLTFKDVANILLESLFKEDPETASPGTPHRSPISAQRRSYEQNVKRRVYDALNVLIAANVLKRRGKRVYIDDDIQPSGTIGKEQPLTSR